MTDVEDAMHLRLELRHVGEVGILPGNDMARRRLETALFHAVNPAWSAVRRWLEARALGTPSLSCARYPSVSSAFWKRPACDFSALARVSNQSAISSKPSSRAVRAIPGYMSVYSWVSPAIAATRLSGVLPIGLPVTGSPTSSRNSRWPCAWPVSPSAVERNTAATSL